MCQPVSGQWPGVQRATQTPQPGTLVQVQQGGRHQRITTKTTTAQLLLHRHFSPTPGRSYLQRFTALGYYNSWGDRVSVGEKTQTEARSKHITYLYIYCFCFPPPPAFVSNISPGIGGPTCGRGAGETVDSGVISAAGPLLTAQSTVRIGKQKSASDVIYHR